MKYYLYLCMMLYLSCNLTSLTQFLNRYLDQRQLISELKSFNKINSLNSDLFTLIPAGNYDPDLLQIADIRKKYLKEGGILYPIKQDGSYSYQVTGTGPKAVRYELQRQLNQHLYNSEKNLKK